MCSVGKRKKKDPVTLLGKYLPTPFSLFLIEASSRVCVCTNRVSCRTKKDNKKKY
jgi:hypothetical protein